MKNLKPVPNYYLKHRLSDGRSVWIQSFVPPGRKTASHYTLIVTGLGLLDAPDMTDFTDLGAATNALADVLRDDVCETL